MPENSSIDFNTHAEPGAVTVSAAPPAPNFDLASYIAELQECGLSEVQAEEYMATQIPLMWHFACIGFDVDISALFLSWADSDALDSDETSDMETPSKAESEVATQ